MECDFEDKYLRIREENLLLKKQANEANNNIKLLTTRLNRLLEMKKRALVNEKNKKLVSLEEMLFNLQLKMGQLESENRKLRQRSLVLQTKLDAVRRRQYRSMYSSVPSRTDSGLEWIDSSSNHNFNSKPSSARLTVHHRSSSTISLNRVTFNSTPSDLVHRNPSDVKFDSVHSIKPMDGQARPFSTSKIGHQRTASGNLLHRISVNEGDVKARGRNNFVQQLLKETQDEIGRLQEIIVLQQHYIDSIQSEVNRANSEEDVSELVKSSQEDGTTEPRRQTIGETTLLTVENSTSHSLNADSIDANFNKTQKSLQVFRSGLDLDKILTTKGIPNEIVVHIEKLTSD
uniref:Uncharacterized protein n=1 Tax=Tetranychus urticae TaxID=32264 RepID=T1KT61_TETUR